MRQATVPMPSHKEPFPGWKLVGETAARIWHTTVVGGGRAISQLRGRAPRRVSALVAVGTAVTRCPPHSPVLALLTHTVPTSDMRVLGVKARTRIGL